MVKGNINWFTEFFELSNIMPPELLRYIENNAKINVDRIYLYDIFGITFLKNKSKIRKSLSVPLNRNYLRSTYFKVIYRNFEFQTRDNKI